jgi:hypothetical protein
MHDSESLQVMAPWRWTLEEYLLRCEQAPMLCEVVVEGALDRDLMNDALQRWGRPAVGVLTAESLTISDEDVRHAGYNTGVKGQLLTLAAELARRSKPAAIEATIMVVVDRDYDDPPPESAWLCLTDGHCIESYALSPVVLNRFVRIVLGRSASRIPGKRKRLTSGHELYGRIIEAASDVAAVRLSLGVITPAVGLLTRWLDYVRISPDGYANARRLDLLIAALAVAHRDSKKASAELALVENARLVRQEPFRLVHGRDFMCILAKLLRSSWGRAAVGIYARADSDALTRAVIGCIDPSELDEQPLFVRMRARFSG